jgi:hypothetical protein
MPRPSPELAFLRAQLVSERERYDALLKEVMTLKREGFSATVQYDQPPAGPSLPGPVTKAIAQRSEPGTVERRELERSVSGMLREGVDPEDVAAAVLDGEQVDL